MIKLIKPPLIASLAIAAAILGGQTTARAVLVGITPGGTHYALDVGRDATPAVGYSESWTVGSAQAPVPIDYLASDGLWLINLDGSMPLNIGQSVEIHEFLTIGSGVTAWDAWNQKFVTEGFNFLAATMKVDGNVVANGITSPPSFNTINFAPGNPLPAGTVIEITKDIEWVGTAGGDFQNIFQGDPDIIEMEEYPGVSRNEILPPVPEPATLSLIGLGLSMAGVASRFRNRKRPPHA